MRYRRALTLVEVVVVLFVLVLIVGLLLPSHSHHHGGHSRSICSANLTGIYKSMYTYSVTNRDVFPSASAPRDDGSAIGFREGDRLTGKGANLDQNMTASLWMLVRDGSTGVGQFICSSTGDEQDPQTASAEDRTVVPLESTFDFLGPAHLNFSSVNMYHRDVRANWGSNAPSSFVLMGDNNGNDSSGSDATKPGRHAMPSDESSNVRTVTPAIANAENSPNHDFEGQNFLYGDSHVSFSNHPFIGVDGDNAYAMGPSSAPSPPTLGNTAPYGPVNVDSVLIPLTGNGGVSLSGLSGLSMPFAEIELDRHERTIDNLRPIAITATVIAVIGCVYFLRPRRVTSPS